LIAIEPKIIISLTAFTSLTPRPGDYNVISVDWSKLSGSGPAEYPVAVANVQRVATHTADFVINSLMDPRVGIMGLNEIPLVVGFSLGAHVAGCLGNLFGGKLSRVTGLDPAGV
jgi:pimeloyl-ACP methyl ester carboxylesterase